MTALRRVTAGIGRTLLWSIAVLLAQSALWADVPWSLKALIISVAALSAWRPHYGLLATAGLVPFGNVMATHVWRAYTFGLGEGLVLACLAGALVPWRRRGGQARADAISYAGITLAMVIVASCAVQFALERAYQDHWLRFTVNSLRYFAFNYLTAEPDVRPWVVGLGFLPPALLWIEGLVLFFLTRALCRATPSLWQRLLVVAVVSSTGAAIFSWARLLNAAWQAGMSPIAVLQINYDRWTGAIPSINPSGSYFAMMSLVALGLAWHARGALRALWIAAAAVIAPAAIITKSRAAIIAVTSMTGIMIARRIIRGWRAGVLLAAIVVIGFVVAVQYVNPFDVVRSHSSVQLRYRAMLAKGSLRMIEANPYFGVGIRQFRLRFPEYRPPEAREIAYAEDDPHNHLLGVGTELGLVGLGAFVWFIGAGIGRAARALRAPLDGAAVGLFCGVMAFLLTGLSHQPLNVPVAALSFWMLFGASQARGSGLVDRGPRPTTPVSSPQPQASGRRRAALQYATAIAVAAILISVPFRARAAIDQMDMTRIQYGFHDWDTDGRGTRFRWTSDHSTMFMSSEMSLINLPIGASLGGTPKGVTVRIFVDGGLAGQLFLTDEVWHDVRLVAPRNGRKSWRIDLYVSPTFVPMEVNPAILDARRLGVRVGEPVQRELLR